MKGFLVSRMKLLFRNKTGISPFFSFVEKGFCGMHCIKIHEILIVRENCSAHQTTSVKKWGAKDLLPKRSFSLDFAKKGARWSCVHFKKIEYSTIMDIQLFKYIQRSTKNNSIHGENILSNYFRYYKKHWKSKL